MKITISQKSQDDTYLFVDDHATMTYSDANMRILYEENDGALVTLDITKDAVMLLRKDRWITHGEFDINEMTQMHIVNEHGTIIVNIQTVDILVEKNQFYMKYHLIQDNQIVDVHELQCTWDAEV